MYIHNLNVNILKCKESMIHINTNILELKSSSCFIVILMSLMTRTLYPGENRLQHFKGNENGPTSITKQGLAIRTVENTQQNKSERKNERDACKEMSEESIHK